MSNTSAMTEEYLEKKIRNLREAYWKGNPLVSDEDYDKMVQELKDINPFNPLLDDIETGTIPADNQIHHKKPMLSLDKIYTEEALFEWVNSIKRSPDEKFLVQPKYDGISCHLEAGVWSTRGDGHVGQNITKVCNALCRVEASEDSMDIYGEIVIKKSDFINHFAKNVKTVSGTPFKNSRNAVVGIITALDTDFYVKQKATLTLVDYNLYSFEVTARDFKVKWGIIKQIITNLDYPMDGIVIKLADKKYSESLGCTAHHPRGQIALKFYNQSAWTELLGVDWGMGKESITATAIFKPIELGGVTINRAVIPMISKTLPCIMKGDFSSGTKLRVERAGDVIPHIVQVETNQNEQPIKITTCPFCGNEVETVDNRVMCTNNDCFEKQVQRLYLSLVTLGIKNVGIETVRSVSKMVRKYAKVSLYGWMWCFNTPQMDFANKLGSVAGFGKTYIANLCNEVEKIKKTTYVKFFAALNIPNAGTAIAENIFKSYRFDDLFTVSPYQLMQIEGIGNKMANRIVDYFVNYEDTIKETMKFFEFNTNTPTTNGTKVCFTGAMVFQRNKMFEYARKAGFEPIDSVTKDCGLLVMADVNSTSTKAVKARKMGIEIMTDKDFLDTYAPGWEKFV